MKFKEIEAEQTRIVEVLVKECTEITGYDFSFRWSNLKNCYLNYNDKMVFVVVFSGVTYRIFDTKGAEVPYDQLEQALIKTLLE